jgi:hypothetical protein
MLNWIDKPALIAADERAAAAYRDASEAIAYREGRGLKASQAMRRREVDAYMMRVATFDALVRAGIVHIDTCIGAETSIAV